MIGEFRGETRWLSNFHFVPIEFEGILYPTTEHAYQAAKTLDMEARKMIAALKTPGEARRAGQKLELRTNWDSIKLDVMKIVNLQKFSRDGLKAKLLATGSQELVEGNYWGDTFWGVCNGVGQNNLGRILMQIRKELQTNDN